MIQRGAGNISRRMIGNVDIFDISGMVKNDTMRKIHDYLSAYVRHSNVHYVIVNVQELAYIDNNGIHEVFNPLERTKKTVLFCTDESVAGIFKNSKKMPFTVICNKERDVVDLLGKQLVNKRQMIAFEDRRKALRIASAISADVICRQKENNDMTMTSGIITNISETGACIEYLDLSSAQLVGQIDFFRNIEATIMANDPHYLNQKMSGEIVRVEISGRQTALIVKFADPIIIPK